MKYFYYYFQRVLRNSLDLDPNPYSGDFWIWIEIFGWIRIRIQLNTDPKHWFLPLGSGFASSE